MTNYQRQQLLGTATAGLAGVGGQYLGSSRSLVGPGGVSGQAGVVNDTAAQKLLAPNPLEVPGATERGYLSRIEGMANRPAIDPLEQQGLNRYGATADPTANLNAAKSYLNTISGPALVNASTAAGFGRSGATQEALANEGTRMTLPILQDSLNAQRGLGQQEQALGSQLRDRDLANLQTALGAAEAPRLAELQSTTKPQQLLLSAYGLPPAPSGAGTASLRGEQNYYPSAFSTAMKGVQAVASIAGAFMGCWVADAVYGSQDPRFWTAWRYVNFHPSWRARLTKRIYFAVGRPLARWARRSRVGKQVCTYLLKAVIPGV